MVTRKLLATVACAALALGIAWGCDDEGRDDVAQDDSGPDSDSDSDSDGDSDSDSDGDSDSDSDGDCSEEAKLVYTVDSAGTLYRFDPPNHSFELVGTMDCESMGTPFSMAVARNDKAYVLFWNGSSCTALNQVSIYDATCEQATEFECGQLGFDTFGMGFATDGPDTTEETLYVGKSDFASTGSQLGYIDTDTWELVPIGPLSDSPEMTGNQDGELWAFFAWAATPKVSQIDKTTGEESNTVYIDELGGSAAFAFAYWGGDFYLFHAPSGEHTTVYRLHEGELEEWVNQMDTGFSVVGAGVSTCAPTVIE